MFLGEISTQTTNPTELLTQNEAHYYSRITNKLTYVKGSALCVKQRFKIAWIPAASTST